jgi:hypothetical protein
MLLTKFIDSLAASISLAYLGMQKTRHVDQLIVRRCQAALVLLLRGRIVGQNALTSQPGCRTPPSSAA